MFTTLDLWIRNQGDKATLDTLFQFMQTVDLFEALKERLNERFKSQKPKKGECVFLIILVVVLIWFSITFISSVSHNINTSFRAYFVFLITGNAIILPKQNIN